MKFIQGIKRVFSKPSYIFLFLFGALFFYVLDLTISHFSGFRLILQTQGFAKLISTMYSYLFPLPGISSRVSWIGMILISILFGSYIALSVFLTKKLKSVKSTSLFGTIAVFLGIIAPGCFVGGVCGIGIASLLGISGFLIALPFQGLEVSFLAIILLSYANWSISNKIGKLLI
jgi:hypothetical protein